MLQRFVQVLQGDDQDDAQADVLRRFWTHAANRSPLPVPLERRPGGRVVELSQWANRHRVER
jgi:hypothetical protein